jgi:dynein heavy chain 1
MATFITMNPGYAGRSNLPDNLKTLFRSVAMVTPDRKLITHVMLFSQGIVTAEHIAPSTVDLFLLCEEHMTKQRHYDFGLRALKTLLVQRWWIKTQGH